MKMPNIFSINVETVNKIVRRNKRRMFESCSFYEITYFRTKFFPRIDEKKEEKN